MRCLDVQVHLLAVKIYLMLHNFDLPAIQVTGGLCEECDPLTRRVFWKNLAKGFFFSSLHSSALLQRYVEKWFVPGGWL